MTRLGAEASRDGTARCWQKPSRSHGSVLPRRCGTQGTPSLIKCADKSLHSTWISWSAHDFSCFSVSVWIIRIVMRRDGLHLRIKRRRRRGKPASVCTDLRIIFRPTPFLPAFSGTHSVDDYSFNRTRSYSANTGTKRCTHFEACKCRGGGPVVLADGECS
jgi:hypothetical protein